MADERINIIIMRDDGASRRYRMPRARLCALLLFFLLMPPLLALSVWFGYTTWSQLCELREDFIELQDQHALADATLSRLLPLEKLLRHADTTPERHIATAMQHSAAAPDAPDVTEQPAAEEPAHAPFPVTDTGVVSLQNTHIRMMQYGRLRMTLDICNTKGKDMASGTVSCQLLTEEGSVVTLPLQPATAGDFRITRRKRTILTALVPRGYSPNNGQVILAVHGYDGVLLYRNIYTISH